MTYSKFYSQLFGGTDPLVDLVQHGLHCYKVNMLIFPDRIYEWFCYQNLKFLTKSIRSYLEVQTHSQLLSGTDLHVHHGLHCYKSKNMQVFCYLNLRFLTIFIRSYLEVQTHSYLLFGTVYMFITAYIARILDLSGQDLRVVLLFKFEIFDKFYSQLFGGPDSLVALVRHSLHVDQAVH